MHVQRFNWAWDTQLPSGPIPLGEKLPEKWIPRLERDPVDYGDLERFRVSDQEGTCVYLKHDRVVRMAHTRTFQFQGRDLFQFDPGEAIAFLNQHLPFLGKINEIHPSLRVVLGDGLVKMVFLFGE